MCAVPTPGSEAGWQRGRFTLMTANEPIAIIGIGCRFPGGANSPAAFWELLTRGVDAVGELPRDRCNPEVWYADDASVPGRLYTRAAACLKELDLFDAD